MKFRHYIIKRQIEDVLIFPFILLGRLIALLKPLKKEYEIFFFFPFYHTGGAEKVHALVAQAIGNNNCIIYFTRKSQDKNFLLDFKKSNCEIEDISSYTDTKFFYFLNLIYRGIITGHINKQQQNAIVFNGQCNFGYKISPWVSKKIPQVELIHSFNTFSWIRIPFLPFITKTIMISQVRVEDHYRQYDKLKIPSFYKTRIKHIVNGILLPLNVQPKKLEGTLKALYVGRGTEEKRVHLIAQIAKKCSEQNLPIEFMFMGEVENAILPELRTYCKLLGHKSKEQEINEIYQEANILFITSYTEGFPMVIEEAMAYGSTIIATPVGDIPIHIKPNKNGYLFSNVNNEELIISEGVNFIFLLCNERNKLKEFEENNKQYATENFSIEAFNFQYQQLFKTLRNSQF